MTMAQWHALAAIELPRKKGAANGEMSAAQALRQFGPMGAMSGG